MKKGFGNPQMIAVFVAVLSLVALVIFASGGAGNGTNGDENRKVICYAKLQNDLLSSVKIASYSCDLGPSCNPLFGLSLFNTGDEGTLKLQIGDQIDNQKYDVGELQSKEYGVSLCTSMRSGVLRTVDSQNVVTDTKSFEVKE